MDDDGTGRITLNEFERHFNDASLAALFEALDLGSTDAWSLFQEPVRVEGLGFRVWGLGFRVCEFLKQRL